jgi:hypothetical protein
MATCRGSEVCGRILRIMTLTGLCILFIPMVCMASTPPVQPSLQFEVPILSGEKNATITLSVTWNGYVSFSKSPEHIIVEVFSVPDGSRVGTFLIPRMDECKSENTCIYRTSVKGEKFPPGTFMLIANDPLSEATGRQMITIPPHRNGNTAFFRTFEQDTVFLLSSIILGAFLVFVLAILVREKI